MTDADQVLRKHACVHCPPDVRDRSIELAASCLAVDVVTAVQLRLVAYALIVELLGLAALVALEAPRPIVLMMAALVLATFSFGAWQHVTVVRRIHGMVRERLEADGEAP